MKRDTGRVRFIRSANELNNCNFSLETKILDDMIGVG